MLRLGEYPVVIRALNILTSRCRPGDIAALIGATGSTHLEVRVRAMDLVARHGSREHALDLLPLLENSDEEVFRFAADTLILWQARDYFGDLDGALSARPAMAGGWRIVSIDGEARALRATARDGEERLRPAIEPRE